MGDRKAFQFVRIDENFATLLGVGEGEDIGRVILATVSAVEAP